MASFLCPDGFVGPQGMTPLLREHRTVIEAGALLGHPVWRGTDVPHGHDLPVLLVPGFMVGDISLKLLSRWLHRKGYQPHRSQVRMNIGCTRALLARLESRLEHLAEHHRCRVAVVGQSLGGLLAKAVAIRRPELVAGIVSLGSPHLAPAAAHPLLLADVAVLAALHRIGLPKVMGADCVRGSCATEAWHQLNRPFPAQVRFTSVYSRTDGVIDWRACLDPAAEHVEVSSSHLGMAVHPGVYRIVGDRLGALAQATVQPPLPAPRLMLPGTAVAC
jgi:triacylglycerol lipase